MMNFKRADGITPLRHFTDVTEMDQTLIQNWNSVVGMTDKVYHLGDVFINKKFAYILNQLNGDKVLIKGNHDIFDLDVYTNHFRDIRAYHVLAKCVLSHVPVHDSQLIRFKANIHGHLHDRVVRDKFGNPDPLYKNVCVEHTNYTPVALDDLLAKL
jgi:calcineurin-like phosphoesterase family protein